MRRLLTTALAVTVLSVSTTTLLLGTVLAGTSAAGGTPDLIGTWTGTYEYPFGTDEVVPADETLVIELQKGRLIWGNDEYVEDGQTIHIPVRGTIGRDGRTFTLAEDGGYFMGEIRGPNRVHVWFVRTDEQFTTFEAVLRRSK